ncbi:MAG: hypothetical protein MZV65_25770 [Chromatiales bacterium]|nr:hypothetical protein [Chromatiales bacterium]
MLGVVFEQHAANEADAEEENQESWLRELQRQRHETERADFDPNADPIQYSGMSRALREFFKTLPSWVYQRLAELDTEPALSPTLLLLGEALELEATSLRVLDFLEVREQSEPLRTLLGRSRRHGLRLNLERLARLLGLELSLIRHTLARRALLRRPGPARHASAIRPTWKTSSRPARCCARC